MEEKEQPLVSVTVITYNSSKTVLETLDSIKAQTYQNIELIVSDDCSTDNTVDLCRKWIEQNKDRFVRTEIITVDKNSGVSANMNRAEKACHGEWIKGIAGDDLLLPNCIQDNIDYITRNPDAIIVMSRPTFIGINPSDFDKYEKKMFDYSFFEMTPEEQYERIKLASCLPASTVFLNRAVFIKYGLDYDERIPMLEDRPMWLNAIKKGIKIHFFDKKTVVYRVREDSLCNAPILSPRFYESTRLAYFYYTFDKTDKEDHERAVKDAVDNEMILYNEYYNMRQLSQTRAFKIAKYICNPQLLLKRVAKMFKIK